MAFCKRLLTALVLLHNSGSLLGGEIKSSIIGGADAPKGKWPWMVHLNMTSEKTGKKWRCGGTIVGKEWVMTAAHCLDNEPHHIKSFVVVGAHELQKKATRYMAITHFLRHPDYKVRGNAYINDIALLKLKKTIHFSKEVEKVGLPDTDDTFSPSSECWITGWGDVANDIPLQSPETLQELKIPIMDQSACKAVYPGLTSDMLCAGDSKGGKDACKGDDGGPLVCRKGTEYVQVGIMSRGSPDGCGLPGRPGIYTQVSKYLNFIDYYVHHTEETSAEV